MINKNSRILITGGNGFCGSHLFKYLTDQGYKHIERYRSQYFDLTDRSQTYQLFKASNPDVVFHLAAKCGGIGANMVKPAEFWSDNLLMGINVLDAANDFGAKLVMLSTCCGYPKHCPVPFKEDDYFNGFPEETNAPYGIAKRSLLVGCEAYHKQYGMKCAYLISANLYGTGDSFDLETSHVIPALINKFSDAVINGKKEVVLWGDGTATRDMLYVDDLCEALEKAMLILNTPYPINIGTGEQISIAALAEMVAKIVYYRGSIVWDKTKPNGQPARQLDITRAKTILKWEPKTKLYDGIKNTYDWYMWKCE